MKNDVFIPNQILPCMGNHSKPNGANHPPKNNNAFINDINIICPYSPKKNNANVIALYSTLYPDTNSLSPSVKSKGARLVSANEETKNIIKAGHKGRTNHIDD